MPKAYSLDLRERVARFAEAGRSCHAAAAHFSVSVSFVVKLMRSFRATGSLTPKPSGGRRHHAGKTLLASEQDRPDVKAAREEWTAIRQPRMRLEPHRLVFL